MNLKKCSRFVIILLLSISSKRSFSQLFIQNKLSVPIDICIGWNQDVGDWNGLETKGWFSLYPGQTIEPGLNFTSNDDYFFFYAKTTTGPLQEITTGTRLLVHPKDGFDIKNADMDYVKNQNPVYEWRMFKRRDIHLKKRQAKTYVFQITISDVVDAL